MQPMSCSGRFVRPFVKVLAKHPALRTEVDRLQAMPPDRRIDLVAAHESVARWVRTTGDADLGLRAALASHLGCAGPLDYAMHSANSVRESLKVASRFASLYSDALDLALTIENGLAIIRLRNKLSAPRAITDFTVGAWFRNHLQVQIEPVSDVECWFSYPRPDDISVHSQVFGAAQLHFGATFDGFSFDAGFLDRPLASAVPLLHAVHCEHLEALGASLVEPLTTTLRVRQLIANALRHGRPSATSIARELHVSRRTLVRRLEGDGTTFRLELDELRRELALRFVAMRTLSLTEITTLLGFSQVQGFHRAFKRWTGQTPLRYRELAEDESNAVAPS
jgi:AraC-like DNA-binding protein